MVGECVGVSTCVSMLPHRELSEMKLFLNVFAICLDEGSNGSFTLCTGSRKLRGGGGGLGSDHEAQKLDYSCLTEAEHRRTSSKSLPRSAIHPAHVMLAQGTDYGFVGEVSLEKRSDGSLSHVIRWVCVV